MLQWSSRESPLRPSSPIWAKSKQKAESAWFSLITIPLGIIRNGFRAVWRTDFVPKTRTGRCGEGFEQQRNEGTKTDSTG
jgi:hypothetical protein